jgi:hypothetical protein
MIGSDGVQGDEDDVGQLFFGITGFRAGVLRTAGETGRKDENRETCEE